MLEHAQSVRNELKQFLRANNYALLNSSDFNVGWWGRLSARLHCQLAYHVRYTISLHGIIIEETLPKPNQA